MNVFIRAFFLFVFGSNLDPLTETVSFQCSETYVSTRDLLFGQVLCLVLCI